MAVFPILPQSEFWPVIRNDHREDTPHFRCLRVKSFNLKPTIREFQIRFHTVSLWCQK